MKTISSPWDEHKNATKFRIFKLRYLFGKSDFGYRKFFTKEISDQVKFKLQH